MREILLNICLTAIALCMFKMLLPENSMKKQADFLIACFFLASLVFFFTSGRISLNYNEDITRVNIPFADFEGAYSEAQGNAVSRETSRAVMQILNNQEIYPQEIVTSVNISDKYSISINEIRLVFESEVEDFDNLTRAVHILQKEVGGNTIISGEFKNE